MMNNNNNNNKYIFSLRNRELRIVYARCNACKNGWNGFEPYSTRSPSLCLPTFWNRIVFGERDLLSFLVDFLFLIFLFFCFFGILSWPYTYQTLSLVICVTGLHFVWSFVRSLLIPILAKYACIQTLDKSKLHIYKINCTYIRTESNTVTFEGCWMDSDPLP